MTKLNLLKLVAGLFSGGSAALGYGVSGLYWRIKHVTIKLCKFILPLLVVSDETLWIVDYSAMAA